MLQFVLDNIILIAVALLSGFMLFWTTFGNRIRGIKDVNCQGAMQLINHKQALVLDVREDSEYKSGHVLNAKHIPLGKLNQRLGELEKYREHPIVVICRSGNRSCTASALLGKQGFGQVYNLNGGVMAWQKANLPLEK